jgi:hypothetical protein
MSKLPIIWEGYHYQHFEKDADWKWSVTIISVTISIISFMFANITFAILILIATFALLMHALQTPRILRFEINTTGVRIDQEKWSFSKMHAFWIEDNRAHHIPSRILFQTDGIIDTLLVLPLPIETDGTDIHDIHEELVKILPEKELNESLVQKMLEYAGF